MKKRLIKKINKTKIDNILNQISTNFTITEKIYGNGYFIFTFGQNTVCHFVLKETPLWKYGIWLDKKGFKIFGEHEWLIDKFKPSRTYLSYENDIQSFIEKIKAISENPKLYFVDSYTSGDALDAYEKEDWGDGEFSFKGYQAIREFNEETQLWDKFRRDESVIQEEFVDNKWDEYCKQREETKQGHEFDRKFAFDFFKTIPNMYSCITAVGIYDRDKNGWKCSPRYDIKIIVDNSIIQEKFDNLYDELEELVFSKNNSEERKSYEHQFSLMGCYSDIKDIKDCNYKFYKTV